MDSSEDARLSGGAGGDSIRHRCSKSRRHVAPVRVSASCAAGGHALRYRWEVALEYGLQQLVHAALERAIHGVARPHYFQGEKVGEHRVYSESLTRFLLANPERIGRHHIARDWYSRRWDSLLDRVETGDLDWNFKQAEEETAQEKHANQDKFRSFIMDETNYFRDATSEAGTHTWQPRSLV